MKPNWFRRITSLTALVLMTTTMAHAQLRIVDNPAGTGALGPSLSAIPGDAGVVLSWLQEHRDGHALKFSVFRDGRFSRAREIARGADWFANWADTPAVHVRSDGTWLAHWLEKSADSTYAYDVRLAHSPDGGEHWNPPRTPHTDDTPTEHGFVSYFSARDGHTGVVWLDGRETLARGQTEHEHAGFMTLRTALVDGNGQTGRARLLDERVCDCCPTASANTALGPIVAYRNRTRDEIRDIAVVRKTPAGWTAPRLVHADGWKIAGCPVNGPSMIARGMQVVVAWFTMAGGVPRVQFAISQDAGASFGTPTTVSSGSTLGRIQLAWEPDGFVLSRMEEGDRSAELRVARYSPEGTQRSDVVITRMDNGRVGGFPRIAFTDGRLLVAWTKRVRDADGENRTEISTGTYRPIASRAGASRVETPRSTRTRKLPERSPLEHDSG